MKRQWLPMIALLPALLASACGTGQEASSETTLSEIYTSVAITLEAGAGAVTSTAVSAPTRTPAPTQTLGVPSTATSGAVVSSAAYASVSACNSSTYVSDVTVEDGTELAPGDAFTKTWEVSNTGTCNWSKHCSLVFVSGDDMGGDDTEIDQRVDPGETADVSVDLTAPDEAGTYIGYWSLADAGGNLFGQRVYVQIVVSEDAATSTSTTTSTPTATATATPSRTPAPTETPTAEPTATEGSGE